MMLFTVLSLTVLGDLKPCDFSYADWPEQFSVTGLTPCVVTSPGDCLAAAAADVPQSELSALVNLSADMTTVPFSPELVTFAWTQVSGPTVTLTNANSSNASFVPEEIGTYIFEVETSWLCRNDVATAEVEVVQVLSPPSELDAELIADVGRSIQVTHSNPGDDRLFIVTQTGTIHIYKGGSVLPTPFLDISDIVNSGGNEQGLLGLAFDPDYETNGFFYVNYTGDPPNTRGSNDRDTRIVAYKRDAVNPDLADPSQNALLMTIDQPESNHNGGQLLFGHDGYLYIATGDGGGGGDNHGLCGNGQNPLTLLGKMLRIEVDGLNPYAIPASNPFVGDPSTLDEIWALGLRNPWRFSFDRQTGDMYIGDVGQGNWEEIDFETADNPGGANYGWRLREGAHNFNLSCANPGGLIDPIYEFSHSGGACSVTGGFVYRGQDMPALRGFYLFADYCGTGSSSSTKRYWTTTLQQGGTWDTNTLEIYVNSNRLIANVSSFGEDAQGEMYIVTLFAGVYKITGIRN